MTPPVALTIAGSDSGGGAGIQADLKTFAALGVFGTSAVTALTAQNTLGVSGVHAVPAGFVDEQITVVVDDFTVRAVKTGMLADVGIVAVVAERAAAGDLPNLVVDPVLVATSGDALFSEGQQQAYLDLLFPHALVVTPNLYEAGLLVGRRLTTIDDMVTAAHELRATGAGSVIIKGGHLDDDEDAVDVVVDADGVSYLRARRVSSDNVHGTGCTFAAAIAAHLAGGESVAEAARLAKEYVTAAITAGRQWRLGAGHGPLDHFWAARPDSTGSEGG